MSRYVRWAIGLVGLLLLFLAITAVMAQGGDGLAIRWWTVDGGGGTMSGGSFTLRGTLGQPDAGTLYGDRFTLTGGFWRSLAQPSTEAIIYLPVVMK